MSIGIVCGCSTNNFAKQQMENSCHCRNIEFNSRKSLYLWMQSIFVLQTTIIRTSESFSSLVCSVHGTGVFAKQIETSGWAESVPHLHVRWMARRTHTHTYTFIHGIYLNNFGIKCREFGSCAAAAAGAHVRRAMCSLHILARSLMNIETRVHVASRCHRLCSKIIYSWRSTVWDRCIFQKFE